MKETEFTKEDIEGAIGNLLEGDLQSRLTELKDRMPDQTDLVVKFTELDKYNPDMATFFLEWPDQFMRFANGKLRDLSGCESAKIRFTELPSDCAIPIRKLRQKDIQKFVALHGIIRSASEVRQRMTVLVQQCNRCGARHNTPIDGDVIVEQKSCPRNAGGCDRDNCLDVVLEACSFVDSQDIELQESPEGMHGGAQPEALKIRLEGDLTKDAVRVMPGDRVILNGIIKTVQTKKHSTTFLMTLGVNSLEYIEHGFDDIQITQEEIEQFKLLALDPKLVEDFAKTLAPSIKGYPKEKQAFILQLFGGQSMELKDGTRTRGEIHIFLLGDPGVAKTVMLRSIDNIAPRVVFAQGGGTSRAGLTATVERDEATGKWALRAGAVVLADGGTFILDEIDKIPKDDLASMHEAMESGSVSIAKAGITATLHTRCSVLGAANPKHGRFVMEEPFASQTDLPPSLLSRFDLIFVMRDIVEAKKDKDIADHIGDRRGGEVNGIKYDSETVRKYIAYARSLNIKLKHDIESKAMISDYYVSMRKKGAAATGAIAITARQIEGIYRLAEANARAHLQDRVTVRDAKIAIEITAHCLNLLAIDEHGNYDADRIFGDTTHAQRSVYETVKKILAWNQDGLTMDELQAAAKDIPERDVKQALERLERMNETYIFKGKIKLV